MAKWEYTLTNGKALHEAIDDGDEQLVVEYLLKCYKELYDKLTDEDKEWKGWDIEDNMDSLVNIDLDDVGNLDYALDDFYDICDDLRAWITL